MMESSRESLNDNDNNREADALRIDVWTLANRVPGSSAVGTDLVSTLDVIR